MTHSFRDTLKQAYSERNKRNTRYSLRAFAKDLGLTSARLSEILNGKKGLSRDAAAGIARKLGMSAAEVRDFCDRVDAQHARGKVTRELAQRRLKSQESAFEAQRLTMDVFRAVSEWQHLTILEALRLSSSEGTTEWLARRLSLGTPQIELSVERLQRLGLLEEKGGKLSPVEDIVLSPDGVPNDAIRKYHEQMLAKASQALFLQSVKERDFFSFVMTIDEADLPVIKKRIRKFVARMNEDFSDKPSAKKVYQLGTQLFAITRE